MADKKVNHPYADKPYMTNADGCTVDSRLAPPNGTLLLCRNLLEADFNSLSEENVRIFKDRLLDMTGCMFGGAIVEEDRFFYDLLKHQGGAPEAPIFTDSSGVRLPLANAVMHNSMLARANDFGNMAMVVFGDPIASHYGETILPVNLTLADIYGVSGQQFIANNIAAEDFTGRLLYTLPVRFPTDMELGSTAACAVALRYAQPGMNAQTPANDSAHPQPGTNARSDTDARSDTPTQPGTDARSDTPTQLNTNARSDTPTQPNTNVRLAKTAFSFAAANATDPANAYFDYSQEYKYHNAESARMGIMAVELAKGGWRGFEDPYFGRDGLITRKVPGGNLPELYEKAFEELGKTFFTEVRFKRGPGGMPTIASAVLGLRLREQILADRGAFDAEQIRRVRILEPEGMRISYYSNPFRMRDHTNALFSYAFACCCTLYHGDRRVDQIQTKSILAHPKLVELAEGTVIDTWKCTSKMPVYKAQAEMTDGKIYEAEADFVGEMFVYPDQEMLQKKFWDQFNAFGKLPKATGEKIIELAANADKLNDMREYTSLLCL